MFKQIILPLLGVIAFIAVVGFYMQKSAKISFPQGTPQSSTKIVSVNGRIVTVEIADTEEKRKAGLSGRTSLEENTGMLFVFQPQDASPIFWMKDMLIPLDIIWINDGKIVKIDANVPAHKEGTPETGLARYTSNTPVDYVLEVPAGFSAVHTIQVGDPVDLSKAQ